MKFAATLRSAVLLLIERPMLFLPKVVDTAIWSWFWLVLADSLANPLSVTVAQLQYMILFLIAMIPIQIWIYNSYFLIVEQYHKDDIDMVEAFRNGIQKLPHGFAAFLIPFFIGFILMLPGLFLLINGIVNEQVLLQIAGIGFAAVAILGTSVVFYFSPVSVIIGEQDFRTEFKRGYQASKTYRNDVLVLTLLSFGLLGVTGVLEGRLENIGILGFLIARGLSSVISLYILLINPTLLLSLDE